jgi:hypothetical protein
VDAVTRSASTDVVAERDNLEHPVTDPVSRPPEALFQEARARRRRRWTLALLLTALVFIAALLISILTIRSIRTPPGTGIHPRTAPVTLTSKAPLLAWVDYLGNLHVGNASTGMQAIVGRAKADPEIPVVSLEGRLFWVDTGCSYANILRCPFSPTSGYTPSQVKEFDPATKKTTSLGLGDAVFAAANGRSIFVVQPRLDCPSTVKGTCDPYAEDLVTIPLGQGGARHVVSVPTGWYLNAGAGYSNPISVANGILVQSALAEVSSTAPRLGLWDPATGRIRQLGRDWGLIGAHTSPDRRSSLLAWLPGSCQPNPHCGLRITDTVTGHSLEVRSPLPYGFDVGGAFSPDGSQLAVFVKTNTGEVNPSMQLGLVNTSTGSLRLVPGVQGEIGESVGWARWLPGGTSVLAGTFSSEYRTYNHYLVNAKTGAVKVVNFSSDRNRDVNFSASTIGDLALGSR